MSFKRFSTLIGLLFLFACKSDESDSSLGPIQLDYEKTYGGFDEDIARDIIAVDDQLFILGNTKSKNDANGDIYLLQVDLEGNLQAEFTYGGNASEIGYSLLATAGNNLLLAGTTTSMGNGQEDIYVLKLDSKGTIQWEKTYGGAMKDSPIDLIETSSGQFCIAGTTESFGEGSRDIYLIWIDQLGNVIREKTYGGVDIDGSSKIVELPNKELLIYGYTANYDANSRDLFLLKVDQQGNTRWSKRFGGDGYEESQAFALSRENDYILHGHSSSIDTNHQMYTVKTDAAGNIIWERHFGGIQHDGGQAMLVNRWNQYLLVGRSMSFGNGRQIYFVQINPEGELIRQQLFGGSGDDWGQAIIEHKGYYFITGHSNSWSNGNNDVYLIRLSH